MTGRLEGPAEAQKPAKTALSPVEQAEVLARLSDPVWRLHNLYWITNKAGKRVKFIPTAEQSALIHAVYVLKQKRHAILKARQMGFSTLIELMLLDAAYFGENIQASIIDQTQAHASEKLEKKIGFAYSNMGPLRERLIEDNARTMAWPNGSSISAGKGARGGTNQWLHISEWGPIAHEDPKRSEEIKTGALPTAEQGIVFVESTFKGGKGGHFYEVLKTAMQTPEHLRTDKDFRFWFFPWYLDKSYTLQGDPAGVPAEVTSYLDRISKKLGVTFTPGQRLWYAKTKAEQGIFMFREYPTTVEEAMSAPVEGAVYGTHIMALRAAGRIIPFQWERGSAVFSSWDLGWSDSTSIWLWQLHSRDKLVIWHTRQKGKTAAEMAKLLNDLDIPIAGHYVPHDAANKTPGTGTSYRDEMTKAGLHNIVVVPRPREIGPGINLVRNLLPTCVFNLPACEDGIAALEAYHTKDTSTAGTVTKEPVHDWSSHDADAFRVFAEALELGMVTPAVVRRSVAANPRYPDGSIVDVEHVREVRRRGRVRALAGHSPL